MKQAVAVILALLLALSILSATAEEIMPEEIVLLPVEGEFGVEDETSEVQANAVEALLPEASNAQTEDPTVLRSLTLPGQMTIGVGEQIELRPEAQPAEAVYSLTCSGGGACVSVDQDAVVTGLKRGEQTIVLTADNGVTASVRVTVMKAPKKVSIGVEKMDLLVGQTEQLTYSLSAGSAGTCTFSAKGDALNVSPEGLVTALSPGSATVTVTTYNGKKDSVKLTVRPSFEITFMDINRNDGILIQCDGEYAFIDSGMRSWGKKAVKFMKKKGVTHLKYYIGTHAHKDHVGGGPAIMAALKTDEVIVSHSGTAKKIKSYAVGTAEKKAVKKVKYRVVKRGETFALGSAEFLVLGPVKVKKVDPRKTAENNNSLILRLTYGENTFLLTGDATGSELSSVNKASPGCLRAQVLKNPHHNGRQEFIINKCKPMITVFSTSKSALPTSSFVRYIKKKGSKVYITAPNRNSDVTISSDGKNLKVKTKK